MRHFKLYCLFILTVAILGGVACSEQFNSDPDAALTANEANIAALTRSVTEIPEYMPLNVIPDWVKVKVTEEEYALWKTMSSIYEIDYSFLEKGLDVKQNEILYETVRNMCRDIVSGENVEYAGYFAVYKLSDDARMNNIERLTRAENLADGSYVAGPSIVHSIEGREAYVMVTAACEVRDGKIVLVKGANAYAVGRDASSFSGSVTGSSYGSNSITVGCAGTLAYYLYNPHSPSGHGRIDYSHFNSTVNIVVFR